MQSTQIKCDSKSHVEYLSINESEYSDTSKILRDKFCMIDIVTLVLRDVSLYDLKTEYATNLDQMILFIFVLYCSDM